MFMVGIQAILFIFSLMWIGNALNHLPGDILLMKLDAREKKWGEFFVGLLVFAILWAGSLVLFFLFVWPVARIFIRAGKALIYGA